MPCDMRVYVLSGVGAFGIAANLRPTLGRSMLPRLIVLQLETVEPGVLVGGGGGGASNQQSQISHRVSVGLLGLSGSLLYSTLLYSTLLYSTLFLPSMAGVMWMTVSKASCHKGPTRPSRSTRSSRSSRCSRSSRSSRSSRPRRTATSTRLGIY